MPPRFDFQGGNRFGIEYVPPPTHPTQTHAQEIVFQCQNSFLLNSLPYKRGFILVFRMSCLINLLLVACKCSRRSLYCQYARPIMMQSDLDIADLYRGLYRVTRVS